LTWYLDCFFFEELEEELEDFEEERELLDEEDLELDFLLEGILDIALDRLPPRDTLTLSPVLFFVSLPLLDKT